MHKVNPSTALLLTDYSVEFVVDILAPAPSSADLERMQRDPRIKRNFVIALALTVIAYIFLTHLLIVLNDSTTGVFARPVQSVHMAFLGSMALGAFITIPVLIITGLGGVYRYLKGCHLGDFKKADLDSFARLAEADDLCPQVRQYLISLCNTGRTLPTVAELQALKQAQDEYSDSVRQQSAQTREEAVLSKIKQEFCVHTDTTSQGDH